MNERKEPMPDALNDTSEANDNHSAAQYMNEDYDAKKEALGSGGPTLNDTPVLKEKTIPPYAGFWMRFWAYLADLIIVGSLNRIIVHPIFKAMDSTSGQGWFSPEAICTAIIFYLYFTLMTKYFKQTLGKMIFGLKVVSVKEEKLGWGTVFFREFIGRFISKTIVIGYLIVGFMPKKQGLHDVFADTTVIVDKR